MEESRSKMTVHDSTASMKADSSIDDEGSHSRQSSFPNSSPTPTSASLCSSSPNSPEKAAKMEESRSKMTVHDSTASIKADSSIDDEGSHSRQSSFPNSSPTFIENKQTDEDLVDKCLDSPTSASLCSSSPNSLEKAAATPNQKSNPSNASYFGRSSPISSRFDSLLKCTSSSSNSSFYLPKSSTATPTDSVPIENKQTDEDLVDKCLDRESKKRKSLDTSFNKEESKKLSVSAATLRKHKPPAQVIASFADLPFLLINKILSKLPQDQAARIPFLCSKMLELFLSDPYIIDPSVVSSWSPLSLDIDCHRLATSSYSFTSLEPAFLKYWLGKFVKGLLRFHRKAIYELKLKVDMRIFGNDEVSVWVCDAMGTSCLSFNLELMDGSNNIVKYLFSPPILGRISQLKVMVQPSFASLKIVRLCRVVLLFIQRLISNSPVLEELYLEDSSVPSRFNVRDERSSLRSLVMHRCNGHTEGVVHPLDPLCQIYIRLGNLVRFSFEGIMVDDSFDVYAKLSEASICFSADEYGELAFIRYHDVIHRFLLSLRPVHKLTICNLCLQDVRELNMRESITPLRIPFMNLEELTVETILEDPEIVKELGSLLISLPNMSKLYINFSSSSNPSETFENLWEEVSATFSSLLYFELKSFVGFKIELDLLAFILGNSPNLMKAKIGMKSIGDPCNSWMKSNFLQFKHNKAQALREASIKFVLDIPKASKVVEIEMVEL